MLTIISIYRAMFVVPRVYVADALAHEEIPLVGGRQFVRSNLSKEDVRLSFITCIYCYLYP